ncbi:MAG: quinone-dependent dihydroorotate dehydrogenase [Nocardioides sp.]|uniref:quinone-dependent dihydroorotate dehydrogenase n=1 Tax=Nocardioides sp. TaxID=35761 RepID=UPI0039E4232E
MIYRRAFDQFLVRMDPELAHRRAFAAIRAAGPVLSRRRFPGTPVTAMGLRFPNALGLAAGFDKDAVGIEALGGLGFGHVEVGTVTARPQPGNPQPRLFRLPSDRAIVNRMGFNNDGAEAVARRLRARSGRRGPVLGINIGKTKVVPDDDQAAVEADYAFSTRLLAPYADYLVVNVSSPNTPGLRSLQAVERLEPLLRRVRREADDVRPAERVPLLVKIAPDLADQDVVAVADLALGLGEEVQGLIATNTTVARDGLRAHPRDVAEIGAGGLSGAPLRARALDVLRLLRGRVADRLTLIGVGGITSTEDAVERLEAGADLIQGYSAFIYEGPGWPRRIASGLAGVAGEGER